MIRRFLHRALVNALGVLVAAQLLPGVNYTQWQGLVAAAVVLGVLNGLLRPVLLLFSLPLIVLTLGLFTTVVNALMLMLTASLVRDFQVNGFWSAFFAGLIVSVFNLLLGPSKRPDRASLHVNLGTPPNAAPTAESRPPAKDQVIDV
jgi:putative membrane protein